MKYMIYDAEVFKHNWCVVFINPYDNNDTCVIWDDRFALVEKINEIIAEKTLLIGFNNKHYDDYIIRSIYHNLGNPFELSQWIIAEKQKPWEFKGMRRCWNPRWLSWDLRSAAINQKNMALGLKEYEANKGYNIHESGIAWNIDRPLTNEEKAAITEYCIADTMATIDMFFEPEQQEELKTRAALIKEFNLPIVKNIGKTNANIMAEIMKAQRINWVSKGDDAHIYRIHPKIWTKDEEILDLYRKPITKEHTKLSVERFGITFEFGTGGLHASVQNYNDSNDHLLIDVFSYYPNLILKHNYMSRASENGQILYQQMLTKRMKYKKEGNPIEKVYKLLLNTLSGCLEAEFNSLFDPHMARGMRITGQLMLFSLAEAIAPYCTLIFVNTDGIMVRDYEENMDQIKEVIKQWEHDTKMSLDFDYYSKAVVKDVNNYILVEKETNKIKVKGGLVKFWEGGHVFNWNCPIIDKCIVNHFIYGTPIEETIMNGSEEIRDYQIIAKVGSTFEDGVHEFNGEMYPLQKVNRVFPTQLAGLGGVFKRKRTPTGELSPHKIPNSPEACFIFNDSIIGLDKETFFTDIQIDYQYYIDRAKTVIDLFEKGEE